MLVASCQFRMQYSEMGLRIQRRLDVKPPCYLAGPSGPAFFLTFFKSIVQPTTWTNPFERRKTLNHIQAKGIDDGG